MPDKTVEKARKFFKRVSETQDYMRKMGRKCLDFIAGEQWEEGDLERRDQQDRPHLTINNLSNYTNQVVNRHSMQRTRITATAFEDADTEQARVKNGLIRHIQHSDKSNASIAYQTAFFHCVTCGYGFWRVDTDYCDEMSFDQEIKIAKIDDPNSVYMTEDDDDQCIVTEWITKEEFKERFPNADISHWDYEDDTHNDWLRDDEVMIAEYWIRERKPTKIYQVQTYSVTRAELSVDTPETPPVPLASETNITPRIETYTEEELKELPEDSYEIIQERDSYTLSVKQYILNSQEVLEENDWAGKYIPIVGVYGRKFELQSGRMFYKSLVYDALDPQILYNYYRSQEAELLAKQPKSPYVGAIGQFEGVEELWQNANIDDVAFLEYNPVTVSGQMAPPPQRQNPPPIPAGFVNAVREAGEEIQKTIGLYDANLGKYDPTETSGRAIIARQEQGDLSTNHFNISFNQALRKTGVILLDLIPHIYDTPRQIAILGEDMTDEIVKINQPYMDAQGKQRNYDMTQGKYDIKIQTGPSQSTRRLAAATDLLDFAKTIPQSAQIIGDMIARNMDFENSEELAMRLKAMIPQEIFVRMRQLEAEEKGQVSPEQQMMQQIQQLAQQLQQMQAINKKVYEENQNLRKQIDTIDYRKQIDSARIKTQADLERERIKSVTDLQEQRMKSQTDIQEARIKQQTDLNK